MDKDLQSLLKHVLAQDVRNALHSHKDTFDNILLSLQTDGDGGGGGDGPASGPGEAWSVILYSLRFGHLSSRPRR